LLVIVLIDLSSFDFKEESITLRDVSLCRAVNKNMIGLVSLKSKEINKNIAR
jgi:hypothetical protein